MIIAEAHWRAPCRRLHSRATVILHYKAKYSMEGGCHRAVNRASTVAVFDEEKKGLERRSANPGVGVALAIVIQGSRSPGELGTRRVIKNEVAGVAGSYPCHLRAGSKHTIVRSRCGCNSWLIENSSCRELRSSAANAPSRAGRRRTPATEAVARSRTDGYTNHSAYSVASRSGRNTAHSFSHGGAIITR